MVHENFCQAYAGFDCNCKLSRKRRNSALPGIWVHGSPARSLEQVESYLSGDAHDRSKVQWFDGDKFHDLTFDNND